MGTVRQRNTAPKSSALMPQYQRYIGHLYEHYAALYLQMHGLRLQRRRFHCRFGEIDLIMRDKQSYVFVEVRFRQNWHYGCGLESINAAKRRRIIKTAAWFMQQQTGNQDCRFDVVSISRPRLWPCITWIQNAFNTDDRY